MAEIKVALVDDQQLVRAGFAMVLDSQEDIQVLWQAGSGKEALKLAAQNTPDVILMDVQMPDGNGIETTREIISQELKNCAGEPVRVVMLTTFASENYVLEAIKAGASGFLLKDTEPEDLLTAVRTVSDSSAIISPQATAALLAAVREAEFADINTDKNTLTNKTAVQPAAQTNMQLIPHPALAEIAAELTQRETEILTLIAKGYSNLEIAAELYISLPTVKTHVGKVLYKTCSRDRVQAVLFALSAGVVSPQEILESSLL